MVLLLTLYFLLGMYEESALYIGNTDKTSSYILGLFFEIPPNHPVLNLAEQNNPKIKGLLGIVRKNFNKN